VSRISKPRENVLTDHAKTTTIKNGGKQDDNSRFRAIYPAAGSLVETQQAADSSAATPPETNGTTR
jgi:hypothetical protein